MHLPLRAVARACAAAAVVGIAVAAVVVLGGRPPLTDVVRVGEAPGGGSATACAPAGDGGGDGGDGEERVSFGQSAPAYRSDLSVCVDGQDLCALGEPVPADAEPVLEVSREAVCGEEPAGWDPAAALLTPQDAAAAQGPGWELEGAADGGALLDPCRDGTAARDDDVVASARQVLASSREAGGSELVQEVLRYASVDAAEAAFEEHLARVERCPVAPAPASPPGHVERYAVVAEPAVPGARAALVQVQPCDDSGACPAQFRSYLLLAHAADGLTTAAYALAEDGDPRDAAEALLAALAERLASTA